MYHLSETLFNNLIKEYLGPVETSNRVSIKFVITFHLKKKTDCIRDTMKLILIKWDERPERHKIV